MQTKRFLLTVLFMLLSVSSRLRAVEPAIILHADFQKPEIALFEGAGIEVVKDAASPQGAHLQCRMLKSGLIFKEFAPKAVQSLLVFASMLAGFILILMGLTGMGSLIKYIPHPVTTGYNTGIAIIIATLQIRDLFGLKVEFDRVVERHIPMTVNGATGVFHAATHDHVQGLPNHFHEKLIVLYHGFLNTPGAQVLHTVMTAGLTIAALLLYPRLFPRAAKRVPSLMVGVCVGVGFAYAANHFFGWNDIETVGSRFGTFSRGLPPLNAEFFQTFDWSYSNLVQFVAPATTIAILCAIASLLSAVVADSMSNTRHDSSSELIAQGIGNILSPLFGGIAVSGAVARTVTNVRNGARTPVSAIAHSITLLLVLLLASPYITLIPMASLGAILFIVAYNMANFSHFRHMMDAPRSDVLVLFTCLALTVFADMAIAVMVGMTLAAMLFMRRMSELTSVDMLNCRNDEELHNHDLVETDIPRGVAIFNVDGPFFFGATEKAIAAMEDLGSHTRIVVLRLTHVPAMDATGLYALEKIYENLRRRKLELIISGARPQPRSVMQKAGFIDKLGPANLTLDIEWALVRCYELLGPEARNRPTGNTVKLLAPKSS